MPLDYSYFRQDYLKAILNYDPFTGIARWKSRPRTDFTLAKQQHSWNRRNADMDAGILDPSTGRFRVSLFEKTWYLDRLLWILHYSVDQGPIYHKNGWAADNRITNMTTHRVEHTKYEGQHIILKYFDGKFNILSPTSSGFHLFGSYSNKLQAKTTFLELVDKLQCGWEDLTPENHQINPPYQHQIKPFTITPED